MDWVYHHTDSTRDHRRRGAARLNGRGSPVLIEDYEEAVAEKSTPRRLGKPSSQR